METEDFGERGVAASPPASTPSANAPSGASAAEGATGERPPNWPLQSFDAADWAAEFRRIAEKNYGVTLDEEWLSGWFANALMRGWDEHARRHSESNPEGQ